MSNFLESLNRGLETKYFGDILDEAVYGGSKWSNLSDEERQRCLNADPTYKGKEDSAGKYSEWIFKIYSDFKKNHPGENFRFDHCKDVLNQFIRSRDNLKDETNKDINRFKSLDELDTFLNNSQSFKNTFVEIPEENSIKDAKKIFENDRCEIWVPLTHETSRRIAGEPKTKWCTAYANPFYYNDYTKDGPLFILIMKDDPSKMYQFHFERNAAMDRRDGWVKWKDFPEMQSQEVQDFRKEYFKDIDNIICHQIDEFLGRSDYSSKEVNKLVGRLHDRDMQRAYSERVDRAIRDSLDGLVSQRGLFNSDIERIKDLISGLDDPTAVKDYEKQVDKNLVNRFYATLPRELVKGSPAVKQLDRCIKPVRLSIPGSVIIGDGAFSQCDKIKAVSLSSPASSIGEEAFASCDKLTGITLPWTITSIGKFAFYGCENLTDVYYRGSEGERDNINIDVGNERLMRATWHYDCAA